MTTQPNVISLFSGTLSITFDERGSGAPTFLLLHGGAGPASLSGLAEALAKSGRVIVPTHPGFVGTARPERFARVDDLVLAYLALLDNLDAKNVVLVGNSFGGWLGAEMALRGSPRIVSLALLNAVGIDGPVADLRALTPKDISALSFHAPAMFAARLANPETLKYIPENQRTLRVYSGEAMHDATLHGRLAKMAIPSLVLWGESDRIVTVDYGRRFAAGMPGSTFQSLSEAGHFPHIERAEEVVRLLIGFAQKAKV